MSIKQASFDAVMDGLNGIDANTQKTMFNANGIDVNTAAHLARYIHTAYELLAKNGK